MSEHTTEKEGRREYTLIHTQALAACGKQVRLHKIRRPHVPMELRFCEEERGWERHGCDARYPQVS